MVLGIGTLVRPCRANTIAVETHPKVVVLSAKDEIVLPLLRAELRELGLEVLEKSLEFVEPTELTPTDDLVNYRIVVTPNEIEVSVYDATTGQRRIREVFTQNGETSLASRTVVLHAVELLRWHLREQAERQTSPPNEMNPGVRIKPLRSPRELPKVTTARFAFHFTLLPHMTFSPGGTSAGAGTALDATLRFGHFGSRVFGSALLLPNRLTDKEGSAEASPQLVGLEVLLFPHPFHAKTSTSLGAGVAIVSNRLRGITKTNYVPHDDYLLTLAPVIDLRLHQSISERFGIVFSSMTLLPIRSTSLIFDEREVGKYGSVLLNLGGGLQLTFD
jgi:hypothetical protein